MKDWDDFELKFRVETADLPLEVIAKFCRHWGIAELYNVPPNVKPWTGPFADTEIFLLMKFRDDVPPKGEHIMMGRYLSKQLRRRVFCGWLSAMWQHPVENDFIRDDVLETMEPVYIDPTAVWPVETKLLRLDDIAKFCRRRGIAEVYRVPAVVRPGTRPYQDPELCFLVEFRDDVTPQDGLSDLDLYFARITSHSVSCRWLHAARQGGEILSAMEPVYVESQAVAAAAGD